MRVAVILAFLLPALASGQEEVITKQLPGQMYEKLGEVRFQPALGTERLSLRHQVLEILDS